MQAASNQEWATTRRCRRRLAAVVMPIFANPPHEVVFVERATHLRRHAGQIAFPGGALDEEDGGDLARAGLRELSEEIGIAPAAVEMVDRLDISPRRRTASWSRPSSRWSSPAPR